MEAIMGRFSPELQKRMKENRPAFKFLADYRPKYPQEGHPQDGGGNLAAKSLEEWGKAGEEIGKRLNKSDL